MKVNIKHEELNKKFFHELPGGRFSSMQMMSG